MSKLDEFTKDCGGYYRKNEEEHFPWEDTRGVWYSLITVENGKLERYGFTAAKGSKKKMCETLKNISIVEDAILLGVWTGQWRTDLFILDIEKSIEHLEALA